jgi:hypothetical protein
VGAHVQGVVDGDDPDRHEPAQVVVVAAGADVDLVGGAEPVQCVG